MAHYLHAGVSLSTFPIVQRVILACPWIHLIHWNPMDKFAKFSYGIAVLGIPPCLLPKDPKSFLKIFPHQTETYWGLEMSRLASKHIFRQNSQEEMVISARL